MDKECKCEAIHEFGHEKDCPQNCNEDTSCNGCEYLDEETLNCNLDVKEE